MSVATLKRKTFAKYNNSSVNSKNGFSLNGTHRNQGYVGQTSLSRSLPRTLMKGNTARGHGGCCGTYKSYPIIQSCVTSTEDNSVVKSSVISTKGLISTRYSCDLSGNTVKPTGDPELHSQWNYLMRKKYCATKDLCNVIPSIPDSCVRCINKDGYVKSVLQLYTKPESLYLSIPYSDYIQRVKSGAMKEDIKYIPVRSSHGEPFPIGKSYNYVIDI
jgi:hypothetical protein